MHRSRRIDYHPDTIDQDLYTHKSRTDYQLRFRGDEGWALCAMLVDVEDPRYPVSFRQQSCIHYSKAKSCCKSAKEIKYPIKFIVEKAHQKLVKVGDIPLQERVP